MNDEKKRILKMVEEGKLTAEEAIQLIDGLEHPSNGQKTDQNPSPFVNYDSNSNYSSQKNYKRPSFMDKFAEFVDTTFQKIKDVDLDFNFGPSHEVHHIFQHRDVYLLNLFLDVSNGDIKIIPWDEQDVRIECQAKVYKVNSNEVAKREFLKNVRFSIDGETMRFSVEPKQIKMKSTLYIPRTSYDEIQIRMFNGHIHAEQLDVKKIKAKTANGNIQGANLNGKEFEFETANGHIKVQDSRAQEIEAETINGTIDVNGAFTRTDLQSFSSNISCQLQDSSSETVFIKSQTGNISLFVIDNMEIKGKVKSNIGGFTCELSNLEIIEEKKDVVQKELHFVANRGKAPALYLEAESRAGSVYVKHMNGKDV